MLQRRHRFDASPLLMSEIMSMKMRQCYYSVLDAIFLLRHLQDPTTPQIIGEEGLEVV